MVGLLHLQDKRLKIMLKNITDKIICQPTLLILFIFAHFVSENFLAFCRLNLIAFFSKKYVTIDFHLLPKTCNNIDHQSVSLSFSFATSFFFHITPKWKLVWVFSRSCIVTKYKRCPISTTVYVGKNVESKHVCEWTHFLLDVGVNKLTAYV